MVIFRLGQSKIFQCIPGFSEWEKVFWSPVASCDDPEVVIPRFCDNAKLALKPSIAPGGLSLGLQHSSGDWNVLRNTLHTDWRKQKKRLHDLRNLSRQRVSRDANPAVPWDFVITRYCYSAGPRQKVVNEFLIACISMLCTIMSYTENVILFYLISLI